MLTRIGLDVPFGRYCATYDDQMALMPRSLAEAFFALENPGPPNAASFGAFTAGFDVQAVRETYGTDPSPDAHYRTCASRYHVSFERPSPWNLSDLNSVTWAKTRTTTRLPVCTGRVTLCHAAIARYAARCAMRGASSAASCR